MKAPLELADPIPTRGQRETRVRLEVLFEECLVELRVVERVERRGQTPQGEDQLELRRDDVDDETEAKLAGEGESGLGFLLNLRQWLAASEEVGDQIVAAVS